MMNRIILSGLFAAVSVLPVFSQEQAPVLDPQFGVKPFSDPDGVYPYTMQQTLDGGFYLGGENGLIRLDAAVNRLWSVLYPVSAWTSAEGNIAFDADNNVYAGVSMYVNSVWEPHILKYDPQGNLLKDYVFSVTSPDSDPAVFGVAYSSNSKRVYAALSYWSDARSGYVAAIAMFDEDLNLIKNVDGPGGIDWSYNSVTGIGVDKDGNVYVGGSRTGSFIYVLKYDLGLNLLFMFAKDPIAPKMFIGGETIPNGGYYIINNELIDNTLHNISAAGAEQWSQLSGIDIYIHGVDGGGNFYGVDNYSQTPQYSKLGYADGVVKWTMPEPHSAMISDIFVDSKNRIYTMGWLMESVGDADMYIARYTQGGAPKYSIAKSMGDNQIVAVSSYTTPLVGLVNGTTGPASGIGVNFSISTFPVGAIGQELSRSSGTTDAAGLADVILKLGNIPAEYGVTATCPTCEASASSVTFTCCGKLPNDHFSQTHTPAWSYNQYARHSSTESNTTIGFLGCGVTALATLSNYYAANVSTSIPTTNPGRLNTYLRGLPGVTGYNANNDVEFSAIGVFSSSTVRYIKRESPNIEEAGITRQVLIDRTNREILAGRPVILQIRRLRPNGTFGPHFILAVGKCGSGYIIADPIGGEERLYNPTDPSARLIGIRVFRP